MHFKITMKEITGLFVCGFILLKIIDAAQYTDKWAVEIDGGEDVARKLALDHGFRYVGPIMPGFYTFQHRRVLRRSTNPSSHHHRTLIKHPQVHWLEQQVVKRRVKRDVFFNDPKWPKQWYLNRAPSGGLDMNVQGAWAMGYTGKGIVVSILDDGIEKNHPDLAENYDPGASYDVNSHDPDPQPRYDYTNENRHGTRCAGEVSAAKNNVCTVGVAYNAKIGGVRMLDGDVTDSVEAEALSLNPNHIDIYSASWGPDDDGRTVDGPAALARKAFSDGVTKGRGGKGSIFVWASGNGGRDGDSCNCDGYTNSIYTLSISSASEKGNIPWYSEACSSTLASTYSSGSGSEKQIVTTDLRKECTETHTGTSASAPLAGGICALALQANPGLTWRDMQHIVVMTARPEGLHSTDWVTNGVGRKVSHSFGYGLMDASNMVGLALNWTNVPEQHICEIPSGDKNKQIPVNGRLRAAVSSDSCQGSPQHHVRYLEHVQARITLQSNRRGDLTIFLTSPMGTRATLLAKRVRDTSREGFSNWAFMSTHTWGENPDGTWELEIENSGSTCKRRSWSYSCYNNPSDTAHSSELNSWTLVLYGTDQIPLSTPRPTTTPPTTTPTTSPPTTSTTSPSTTTTLKTTSTPKPTTLKSTTITPKTDLTPKPTQNTTPLVKISTEKSVTYKVASEPSVVTSTQTSPVETPTAKLKNWTLVLYGTSTHPQSSSTVKTSTSSVPTEKPPYINCAGMNLSDGTCIECLSGMFLYKNKCLMKCPSGTFGTFIIVKGGSLENRTVEMAVCKVCPEGCNLCKGNNPTDCLTCKEGYKMEKNACIQQLIMGFLDPKMIPMYSIALFFCITAILLFFIIFGLLHLRVHQKMCFVEKEPRIEDKNGKGGYDALTVKYENGDSKHNGDNHHLLLSESESDLEFETAIKQ
ncbi:unnamed protein product [Owenia fusiformis]|uniref:P/Homo B domain-containing protein n=1 Tax=Owenia fusiformis TaxID=6347 RepID=A0A8S4Q292_OWEFU|nr:unnamed protein product [Owenia fusiformis]